ncbi:MAG: SDR family oxidoreductase [Sphingorhabdus sp.]
MTDTTTPSSSPDVDRRKALASLGLGLGAVAAAGAFGSSASAQTGARNAGAASAAKPLAGKAAIVTGARANMGRGFAVALAELGADVIVHHHKPASRAQAEETAAMVRAAGSRAELVNGDLGNAANVTRLFDACQSSFGGLDILVNNAGAIVKKPLAELSNDDIERMINSNTRLNYLCMREGAKRIRDGGRIINVGTSLLAGITPNYSAYAGTKAPVEEMTRAAARELGTRGITVNVVAPGPIDTPFFHSMETPQSTEFATNLAPAKRLGRIDDISGVVAFLASPQAAWVNGQTLFINGGYLTR